MAAPTPDPPERYDVAVIVCTILRPSLLAAIRSIYAQDFPGRVQILIGVDAAEDRDGLLPRLRAECPPHMLLTVVELGYSTAKVRGGLYMNCHGGTLSAILAYAAHARYITWLDDDNWLAPDHLGALRAAVQGFDWAFTLRWYADGGTGRVLGLDEWESVGPGRGFYAQREGGFVDMNCFMLDKLACHFVIPVLAMAMFTDGTGQDRRLFHVLCNRHSVGWTGRPTVYYAIRADDPIHSRRKAWLASRGVIFP
jgi:hypothetical protein